MHQKVSNLLQNALVFRPHSSAKFRLACSMAIAYRSYLFMELAAPLLRNSFLHVCFVMVLEIRPINSRGKEPAGDFDYGFICY